ncbi:MAG: hypothetical protein ACREOZ_03465, partial [Gloeomargaritales cyanobacterium]
MACGGGNSALNFDRNDSSSKANKKELFELNEREATSAMQFCDPAIDTVNKGEDCVTRCLSAK